MKIFDLHCDTAYEMQKKGVGLSSGLQISLDSIQTLLRPEKYILVTAIWEDPALSHDAAYRHFFSVLSHLKKELSEKTAVPFPETFDCILAVEGCSFVCDDISRLTVLYDCGVRIITPVWKGVSEIGGAYDSDEGLTNTGKMVVCRAFELGMTVDVSHTSDKCFDDILKLSVDSGGRVIASHSDMRSVCAHPRNLTDEMFRRLCSLGAVVGICLAPSHLNESGKACIDDIIRHIYKCVDMNGADNVSLGCDFDGIQDTPAEIRNACGLGILYDRLCSEFTQETADRIFFGNAGRFFAGTDTLGKLIHGRKE